MAGDGRVPAIGAAIRAVLGDPSWLKKVAVGAGVSLIPYVGAVWLMGYGLTYLRHAAWDPGAGLPEWPPHGERLKIGLYGFVVGLVYALPLSLVLSAVLMALAAGGVFVLRENDPLPFVIVMLAGGLAVTVVLLAYGVALLPVYAHVAIQDSFEGAFDVKGILERTRRNAATFWTAYRRSLVLVLLSMLLVGVVAFVAAAAAAAGTFALLPDDAKPLLALAIIPIEFVAVVLALFIQVPLSLANYRLWAGYARVAYELDSRVVTAP